jgi:hypothetical protein
MKAVLREEVRLVTARSSSSAAALGDCSATAA